GGLGGISSGRTPSCLPEIPLHPPLKKGGSETPDGFARVVYTLAQLGLGARREGSNSQTAQKLSAKAGIFPPFCKGGLGGISAEHPDAPCTGSTECCEMLAAWEYAFSEFAPSRQLG